MSIQGHIPKVRAPRRPISAVTAGAVDRRRLERVHQPTPLMAAERQFRSVANTLPAMIWSTTPGSDTVFYNDQWYAFTGLARDCIDSRAWADKIHPDDRDPTLAACRISAASGDPYEFECRLIHASGAYRQILCRATPIHGENGELVRWTGTCSDIQELFDCKRDNKVAIEDLKSRQAHLQSILDSVPDGMIVIDEDGAIQSFSAAAEVQFGWGAADVIGSNVSMLMPQSYHYKDTGQHRSVGFSRVVVGERRDGTTFPMELSVGETQSSGRRFFTGFVRDLSEHQAAERRFQDIQSELAHVSRLSAMGEMAAGLAHELNQPLSASSAYIQGALLRLEREPDDAATVRDALTKAGEQILRAGEIIRRLREFVAKGVSEQRPEKLPRLLEEATALAMIGAKEQGVRLRYNVDHKVRLVMADKVQIQQVILNLMRNAIEAMADSPRRELVVSAADAAGDMVEVSISDTGPGISAEVADRLFQPFISTKPNGMGVGLSISQAIIEAHGGRMFVDQNPGGGTIFRFTLKAVAGARADEESI